MRPGDLPAVGALVDAGPNDRVFDGMLLAGPVVLVVLAAVGRNAATLGLVALYLVAFVGYVLYRGLATDRP